MPSYVFCSADIASDRGEITKGPQKTSEFPILKRDTCQRRNVVVNRNYVKPRNGVVMFPRDDGTLGEVAGAYLWNEEKKAVEIAAAVMATRGA